MLLTYVNSKIFHENLLAVDKIKETLKLDRPAYVGICILDLSKTLVYDFHYNYIKKRCNNKTKLLFTHEIETQDIYEELRQDKICFTTVIIQKTVNVLIQQTKKLSANLKMKQLVCLL